MSKTIDQELLPCPFCGCQVGLVKGFKYPTIRGDHSLTCPFLDDEPIASAEEWNTRAAVQPAGVAVPEGYAIMPKRLTAENGAKGALLGEFTIEHEVSCSACSGEDDEDCDVCGGEGSYMIHVPVSWDLIKDIYVAAVDAVAAPHPVSGEQKLERWFAACGDHRDTLIAIHGERSGHIASGIPESQAHDLIKAHNAGVPESVHRAQQGEQAS